MRSVKQRKHKKNNSLRQYKKRNNKKNKNKNKNMIGGANKSFELELNDDVFDNKTITNDDDQQLQEKINDINQLQEILKKMTFTNDDVTLLKKYYKNAISFYIKSLNYNSENPWEYPFIRRNQNFDIVQLMQKLEDKKKIIEARIKLLEDNNVVENPMHQTTNKDNINNINNIDSSLDSKNINVDDVEDNNVVKNPMHQTTNKDNIESSLDSKNINVDDVKITIDPDENVKQEEVEILKTNAESKPDSDSDSETKQKRLELETEITTLNKQLDEVRNDYESELLSISNVLSAVESLKELDKSKFEEDKNKLILKLQNLNEQIVKSNSKNNDLETNIIKMMEESKKILLERENEIKEFKTQKTKLEETIKAAGVEKDELQEKSEESIKQTKSDREAEITVLTDTHATEISKKNEETNELKQQITDLTEERDSLKMDLLSALLKDPTKIEVSLDKKRFYTDICKNIKNIIINAYFLDMLFDKQLGSKPEPRVVEGEELSSLSPAEQTKQNKITEMKNKILSTRTNLYTFLQELVKNLGVDDPEILSGLQNIDEFAKTALEANMALYLTASAFFMLGGSKDNNKGKKKGKTLKSLGLRNKKLTKSLRSIMMSGGVNSENEEILDNLITKVITDICQQMALTQNLLSYIQDASFDMTTFNLVFLGFNSVYQERNASKKELEPITNFLVPFKEPELNNKDIKDLIAEFKVFLEGKNTKTDEIIINEDMSEEKE